MRNLVLALCLALTSTIALAKQWGNIDVCQNLQKCEDGTAKLTSEELTLLKKLMAGLKPGMSEAEITAFFGYKPFKQVPPMKAIVGPSGTMISGADWWTTTKKDNSADPNIDVVFWNGKAVSFRWWIDMPRKYVKVYPSEK